jgi:hypothetical protein
MPFAAEQNEELDPVQLSIDGSPTVAVNPHESSTDSRKGDLVIFDTSSMKCSEEPILIPFGRAGVEEEYIFTIVLDY